MDERLPNPFLCNFATHLSEIRDRLGITQKVLAEKSGISKPTIVAIEGEPTRLSRTHALALFFVITTELDQKAATAKSIDYSNVAKAAATLAAAGFTAKIFNVTLGSMVGALIAPAAARIAIPYLFRGKSSKKPDQTEHMDSVTLKNLATESVGVIRKEILQILGIKSLSLQDFMAEIEKNEPEKNRG